MLDSAYNPVKNHICELTLIVLYVPDENLVVIPGMKVAVFFVTWLRRMVSPTLMLLVANFLHNATSVLLVSSAMTPLSTSMSLLLEGIVAIGWS